MDFSPADILTKIEDSIVLQMHMSQEDFAKARLMQYMTEAGYIGKKENDKWIFSEYRFKETAGDKDNIAISGSGFKGKSLFDLLSSDNIDIKKSVLNLLNELYTEAINQNIQLKSPSKLFTIISDDLTSVLFLPNELSTRALLNLSDETFSFFTGCYNNPALDVSNNLRFNLSCYYYEFITGNKPYKNLNSELRYEDYYDGYFLPLEYYKNCTNSNAGKIITTYLKKNCPKFRNITITEHIPNIEEFYLENPKNLNAEDKKAATEKWNKVFVKKTNFFRKCRKNSFKLKTLAFILATIIVLVIGFFAGRTPPPDVKGLTSRQVVETAMTGISKLDVQLYTSCLRSHNDGRKIEEMIASFYTSGKMRQLYDIDAGTLPVNQWFHLKNQKHYANYWSFGLTNLLIDGEPGDLSANYHKHDKKEVVKFLTEEDGKILHKGHTKSYKLNYYLVYHQTFNNIFVHKYDTLVTLVFNGKRWKITNIDDKYEEITVDTKKFNNDYNKLLNDNLTPFEAVKILRNDYPWVPTDVELEKGDAEVREYFTNLYTVKKQE